MRKLLLATTALILISGTAFAQNNFNSNRNTSTSSATTNSTANSQSGSAATNAGNNQSTTFNTNVPANTTATVRDNVNYSGGSTSTINGDQTIRTAPTVYAPPVSGGNPCTLAVSGGASFLGWGAAAGGTFVDQDCADRQKIAMIWNAGFKGAAKELMCNDRNTYNAFKTAGEPCALRPDWEPKGVAAPTPIVQQAPAPMVQQVPPQPVAKQYPRCNPARGINDNCQS